MARISPQKAIVASLIGVLALAVIITTACKKEFNENELSNSTATPNLSQTYNYGVGSDNLVTLGRVLFYDKNLSLNNGISCGSCHKQEFGFGDNQQFSPGLMGKLSSRNTSTLISPISIFGASAFFWDGRAADLESAAIMPVLNQDEMHAIDVQLLPGKLAKLDYYPQLFQNAFSTPEITVPRIRIALAAFMRALISSNSRVVGLFISGQLTYDELQGENIFQGKAKCYSCHKGQDFSTYDGSEFWNIGLDYDYADKGRYMITGEEKTKGAFKLPHLRNIAQSAPYMHDGRFNTLREVIDHYDHGIINNPQLSYRLRDIPQSVISNVPVGVLPEDVDFSMYPPQSLNLTEIEKRQLEAYLRAMSDPVLLNHPKYSDPFRRQ
jgi:cytochrome c peroxidase